MAGHAHSSVNLKLPRLKEAGVAEEMLLNVQGNLIRQLQQLSQKIFTQQGEAAQEGINESGGDLGHSSSRPQEVE